MSEQVKLVQIIVNLPSKSVEIRAFKDDGVEPCKDAPDFDQNELYGPKKIVALFEEIAAKLAASLHQSAADTIDICVDSKNKIISCPPVADKSPK